MEWMSTTVHTTATMGTAGTDIATRRRTAVKIRHISIPALLAGAFVLGGLAQAQKESLLIGPGDIVHVVVFDTPELEQHVRITDSGDLNLVMGGTAHVADLTPADAARKVEDILLKGQILNHPKVAITVEEYATAKVSVLGDVRAPGAYAINTPRTVLDVLTLSGGLLPTADRKVLIERRGTKEKIPYY